MTESSDIKNLHERLLAIMGEVKYIQKGDRKVNNQYRFVSHDQVVNALHDPFVKHGVTVIPTTIDLKQEGNRTQVMLAVTLVNSDNPEDKVSVVMPGYGIDPQDKGPGKAVSYAFKYALLKLLMLETGDDPDQDVGQDYDHKSAEKPAKPEVKGADPEPDWQAWWDQFRIDLADCENENQRKKLVSSVGALKPKMSKELIEAVAVALSERKQEFAAAEEGTTDESE